MISISSPDRSLFINDCIDIRPALRIPHLPSYSSLKLVIVLFPFLSILRHYTWVIMETIHVVGLVFIIYKFI